MFDFLKGKIEIQLNNYNYRPGDTVQGNLILKMKKPVKADGLLVRLTAQRRSTSGFGNRRRTQWETLYDFKQPLDGQKEYILTGGQPQSYPFQITIPANMQQNQMPDGTLGNVVKAAQFLSGGSSRISWTLKGYLDIPAGIDISKKVQINVA